MSVQLTSDDLARVRIPAELNREQDQFYSVLKAQTLEAAIRRAASWSNTDGVAAVHQGDMAECLKGVLSNSLSNLSVTFPPVEARHIRIAS